MTLAQARPLEDPADPLPTDRLGYVAALDGVRALAVLAVMAYHSGWGWARGGYLGVDVFFVLSGFLITTLLLEEWLASGRIRLLAFWGRRVRRLLPALVVVTVVTLLTALAVGDSRGSANGLDALASLLYLNNWNQTINSTDYFDTFLGASPFLHTWSLAIEEQFYLVWPPILLVILARSSRSLGALWSWVAAISLVSTAMMLVRYDPATPTPAYVGSDTRLHSLAVGALAASLLTAPAYRGRILAWLRGRPVAASLLASTALALVVACLVTVAGDTQQLFRGGFLLFACAVAVLLVVVVACPDVVVGRGLRWGPFVAIGRISYGVYLWHWPIFTLVTAERTGLVGVPLDVLHYSLTFGLATLSYLTVERPIRKRAVARAWGVVAERCLLVGMVVLAGGLAVGVLRTGPVTLAHGGSADQFQRGTGALSVYLFGDSVAFGLRRDFDTTAHPEIALSGSTELGCPAFPVTNVIDGKADPPKGFCADWYEQWPAELASLSPDISVLPASQWLLYDPMAEDGSTITFGGPQWASFLTGMYDTALDSMVPHSRHVLLVNQPCYRVYDDGTSPYARTINDDERVRVFNEFLTTYARERGLPLLDLNSWLCGPGQDPEWRQGVKMRVEGLHFTNEGAQLVWEWLAPQLREIAESPVVPAESGTSTASTSAASTSAGSSPRSGSEPNTL